MSSHAGYNFYYKHFTHMSLNFQPTENMRRENNSQVTRQQMHPLQGFSFLLFHDALELRRYRLAHYIQMHGPACDVLSLIEVKWKRWSKTLHQ